MPFEFLDHTADIGVRITAGSPTELMAETVRAFYAILMEEESIPRVEAREERTLDRSAPDGESILVDLLGELIYRFDAEKLLLPIIMVEEVRLDPGASRLRARLRGERFDPARHVLRTEVKAATYHDLEIRQSGGGLSVDVIFDL